MNNLQRLHAEFDQSPWIDFIDRQLVESGRLAVLVESGIRGLTSNPTIFARAVASGQYDGLVRDAIQRGEPARMIYQAIAVGDVRDAADVLREVYDASEGADGYVSIEVEPDLAADSDGTLARARELWTLVDRPNIFVKIPATAAGLPAISEAIAEGININVTLMFGVEMYRRVAHAYLDGLRRRATEGWQVDRVASVASFFVSRVDTKIDRWLDEIGTDAALAARGKAAVANARMAYLAFGETFHGAHWHMLESAGARVQRPLWASTSTKNPAYRDVLYVEELIGPHTVNTMPTDTISAFLDHGELRPTLEADPDAAVAILAELAGLGIDLERATDELLAEGVIAFAASFDELIAAIEAKRTTLAGA